MITLKPADWQERGEGMMTPKQQCMLNAICGDLAAGLYWHGQRLTKDDLRHMVAGTMLGWRLMPAIDRGRAPPGHIMLGGSSLKLTKSHACDAITALVQIGDHPEEWGMRARPVRWSDTVLLELGHNPRDFLEAA
jgi:hypothetical protein